MSEKLLWLQESRGLYIPQDFANMFSDRSAVHGVSDEDWAILAAGPDHADYWEAWDEVLNNASITGNGIVYTLFQDGDLWLIPEDYDWENE